MVSPFRNSCTHFSRLLHALFEALAHPLRDVRTPSTKHSHNQYGNLVSPIRICFYPIHMNYRSQIYGLALIIIGVTARKYDTWDVILSCPLLRGARLFLPKTGKLSQKRYMVVICLATYDLPQSPRTRAFAARRVIWLHVFAI